MSIIPPGLTRLLQFYLSGPMPCPYLPDRVERKLFTRLGGVPDTDSEINAALTRAGFRRSHDILYRPACSECNACVPVRVPVHAFHPSRSLRRIAALNQDLRLESVAPVLTEELFDLFTRYQTVRHPDGDMARMSRHDMTLMLQEGQVETYLYQLRDPTNRLVGAIIADHISDGVSAVYSFFDPAESRRSLGAQLILSLIQAMRDASQPYVYLGYWIAASRKMAYKSRFRPLQALGPHGWDWLDLTDDKK